MKDATSNEQAPTNTSNQTQVFLDYLKKFPYEFAKGYALRNAPISQYSNMAVWSISAFDDRSLPIIMAQGFTASLISGANSTYQKYIVDKRSGWDTAALVTSELILNVVIFSALVGIRIGAGLPTIFGAEWTNKMNNEGIHSSYAAQETIERNTYDYYQVLAWSSMFCANAGLRFLALKAENHNQTLPGSQSKSDTALIISSLRYAVIETALLFSMNWGVRETIQKAAGPEGTSRPVSYEEGRSSNIQGNSWQEFNGVSVESCLLSKHSNYPSGHTGTTVACALRVMQFCIEMDKYLTQKGISEIHPSRWLNKILGLAACLAAAATGLGRVFADCHSWSAMITGALKAVEVNHGNNLAGSIIISRIENKLTEGTSNAAALAKSLCCNWKTPEHKTALLNSNNNTEQTGPLESNSHTK